MRDLWMVCMYMYYICSLHTGHDVMLSLSNVQVSRSIFHLDR
jgi:hypothetical protein